MNYSKLLVTVLIFSLCFGCKNDDDAPDAVPNIYENCCGQAPTQMDFNPGKVYVPNIFTPKSLDGFNDHFIVYTDDEIETIEELRITNSNGVVVYEDLDFPPNELLYGWIPDETVENGFYDYFVKVKNSNGDEFDITGGVCVFVCDDLNPLNFTDSCGFPIQHDGDGGFNFTASNNEQDCP